MAQPPHCCQHNFGSRRLITANLWCVLILGSCCGGCWQEVHYIPTKSAPTKVVAKEAAHQETPGETPGETPEVTGGKGLPAPAEEPDAGLDVALVAEPILVLSPMEEPVLDFGETAPAIEGPSGGSTEASLPAKSELDERLTGLEVWQMASKWSMAAALQAKDSPAKTYSDRLEQAQHGAQALGILLPELPAFEEGTDRLPTSLTFLLEHAGPRLADALSEKHGEKHAALAELATKTHVLLLIYTPNSTRLEPVIQAIRNAAEASGLPEVVWRELVDLLEARSEFKQVKAAIYGLHRGAVDALGNEDEN